MLCSMFYTYRNKINLKSQILYKKAFHTRYGSNMWHSYLCYINHITTVRDVSMYCINEKSTGRTRRAKKKENRGWQHTTLRGPAFPENSRSFPKHVLDIFDRLCRTHTIKEFPVLVYAGNCSSSMGY